MARANVSSLMGLTIRSSRARFAVSDRPEPHRAGRLNSGVGRLRAIGSDWVASSVLSLRSVPCSSVNFSPRVVGFNFSFVVFGEFD